MLVCGSASATERKPKVSISIEHVLNRIHPPNKMANAAVDVQFQNSEDFDAQIVFSSSLWWMDERLKKSLGDVPQFQGDWRTQADFALMHYSIFNQAGMKIFDDLLDVSNKDLSVPKNESRWIRVPIHVPNKPGKYLLRIEFDNERLSESVHTNSNSGRCVFLKAKSEAEFQIPDVQKVPRKRAIGQARK